MTVWKYFCSRMFKTLRYPANLIVFSAINCPVKSAWRRSSPYTWPWTNWLHLPRPHLPRNSAESWPLPIPLLSWSSDIFTAQVTLWPSCESAFVILHMVDSNLKPFLARSHSPGLLSHSRVPPRTPFGVSCTPLHAALRLPCFCALRTGWETSPKRLHQLSKVTQGV